MAYIGRDIQYGILDKQTLTGANGSKTQWTDLTYGVGSASSLLVSVGGVIQEPDVAYTASGNVLNFTEAPETGDTVFVVYLGKELSVATAQSDLAYQTGTGDDTTTPITTMNRSVPAAEDIMVMLNGVTQVPGTDYTVNGTTLTFTSAVASGVNILVYFLGIAANIGTPSDGTVTTAKIANDAVTTAKIVNNAVDETKLKDATVSPAKLTSDTRSYFNRNDIINGGYLVNQENNTAATDDAYSIGDLFNYVGENSTTTSLQTSGGPQGDRNFARINIDNANAQAGWVYFLTNDDCQDYIANGKLSFGVQAKTTSGAIDTIRIGILKWTGTADSVTSDVVGTWASDGTDPTLATNWSYENTPSDLNLTTSWQRFTVENVTVDSDTKNIAIFIWTDDGTITANDQLDVTEWQLNPGATVNDFSSPDEATALKQVQYYLEELNYADGTHQIITSVQVYTTSLAMGTVPSQPKFIAPTITHSGAGTFALTNSGATREVCSNVTLNHANAEGGFKVTATKTTANLTAGDASVFSRDSTDTTWILLDSRL